MESTNINNNQMFLSEFKELSKELSAIKKRIVQLEKSHEKQQEQIDVLEKENHALKTELNHLNGNLVLKKSTSSGGFESLNDDTLGLILEFLGKKSYYAYGATNKRCCEIFLAKNLPKETFLYGYAPLAVIIVIIDKVNILIEKTTEEEREDYELLKPVGQGVVLYNRNDVLAWALQDRKNKVLLAICNVAAGEGRLDIVNRVWRNVNDDTYDKELIFRDADEKATIHGKLDLLKWLDIRGLFRLRDTGNEFCAKFTARHGHLHIIQWLQEEKGMELDEKRCAEEAAYGGHIHILQWLREEKGFELNRELYDWAFGGDHLHVMKWLREQEVPWSEDSLCSAAFDGNLELLQWLHDEGCPWSDNTLYLDEYDLNPEVSNWLRANGFGDRILNL